MRSLLPLLLIISMTELLHAQPANTPEPVFAPITDDAKLPRVLLIGDSISIGYTLAVREQLAGKANVHRIPENGGPTTNGLAKLDKWLGDKKWDVIHVNFGLHDVKHVDEKGQNTSADKGVRQVKPEQYEKNLQEIKQRLEKTGARVIFCTTTPIPAGAMSRVPGDEVEYNKIALRVFQNGAAINDLYTFALPQLNKIQNQADVHFTYEGSKILAGKVSETIERALKARVKP